MLSILTLKLPEEAEKIEIFPKFQRWIKKTNIFKCKQPAVHFTISNRTPYNKLLTNLAFSNRTGEYWPSIVFVRTERSEVRTVTTSGQYSPVRPSRSVSKRLLAGRMGLSSFVQLSQKKKAGTAKLFNNNFQISETCSDPEGRIIACDLRVNGKQLIQSGQTANDSSC